MWVRRHQRGDGLAEVFFVLDRHLDPAEEPSPVVRAVYGTEFHRLARLDNAWAAGATSRIFPPAAAGGELWDAAWGAYLDSPVPISAEAWALLDDQYLIAVGRLAAASGERAGRRDVRLGQHLITRYLAGEITLDGGDQLLDGFYGAAPVAVRAEMAEYIGWNLLESGIGTGSGVLSRLTRLWERRLAAASPSADKDELVRFGEWFASGCFDDDWSLRQLARVITLTGEARPDILVLRRLAELAPARAQLCLDIISEWVRQLPDDAWRFSAREEYLGRILAAWRVRTPRRRRWPSRSSMAPSAAGTRDFVISCRLAPRDAASWARPPCAAVRDHVGLTCHGLTTQRVLWMNRAQVVDEPVDKGSGPGDNGGCPVDVVWMAKESSDRCHLGLVPQVKRQ